MAARPVPLRDILLLLPGLLVLVGGVLLGVLNGGFNPATWYPAALFLLILLAVTLVAAPPAPRERSRLISIAMALYGLFCVWSYLAIAWADSPGGAWEGANRALFYGLAIALVVLRPWSRLALTVAFASVAGGLTAAAGVVLVGGALSSDPSTLLQEGRLAEPVGYVNATAGLWLIGVWPALALALDRRLPLLARAAGVGAATLLTQTVFLSQSRGGAIALVAAALVFVAVVPRRWPALGVLGLVAGATLVTFGAVADVRDAATVAEANRAFDGAVEAIVAASAIAVAAAALLLHAGRRAGKWTAERPGVQRRGDWALAVLAAIAAVAALVAIGNPADWANDRWDDFKSSGYTEVEQSPNRFSGSLGSGRYDFYRVAWDQFRDNPLTGVGQDNFANEYLLRREGGEAPRHPHSLILRTLSQAGLIGSALFFGALALLVAAAARARRRVSAPDGVLVTGGLAAFAAWFVQAAGDWLWAFPALGIIAIGLLGAAARLRPAGHEPPAGPASPGPPADRGPGQRFRTLSRRTALSLAMVAVGLSLVCAGVAARYTSAAYDASTADIDTALRQLDRAADLNPLSAEPLLAKGVLDQRVGRYRDAIVALREAAEREPDNWFTHLELGLALAAVDRDRAAIASLAEARRRNPRQPLTAEVIAEVRAGREVSAAEVERLLSRALERRLRPVDPGAADTP